MELTVCVRACAGTEWDFVYKVSDMVESWWVCVM
jgi:hypothetical protein